MAATQSFDLLVTDMMMPGIRGDELVRRLRMTAPDLPVLHLTGYSDHLFAERVVLGEHEAFLDKPCSVKGLLEAIALVTKGDVDESRHSLRDPGRPDAQDC